MARLAAAGGRAFTLIELLIVVAIIAILAAIAVPNFLEAQARAKVGRELSDMRTLATALESYAVDHSRYPPHSELLADGTLNYPALLGGLAAVDLLPGGPLTTPVAHMNALPPDPYAPADAAGALARSYGYVESRRMADILLGKGMIDSANGIVPTYGGWRLYAAGPDADRGRDAKLNILYDPTNGTVSDGDIVRSQRTPRLTLSQDEHQVNPPEVQPATCA